MLNICIKFILTIKLINCTFKMGILILRCCVDKADNVCCLKVHEKIKKKKIKNYSQNILLYLLCKICISTKIC